MLCALPEPRLWARPVAHERGDPDRPPAGGSGIRNSDSGVLCMVTLVTSYKMVLAGNNVVMSAGKRSCPDMICYLLSVLGYSSPYWGFGHGFGQNLAWWARLSSGGALPPAVGCPEAERVAVAVRVRTPPVLKLPRLSH